MKPYEVYWAKVYFEEDRTKFKMRRSVYLRTLEDGRHVFLKTTTENNKPQYNVEVKDFKAAGLDHCSCIQPLKVKILFPHEVREMAGELSKDDKAALVDWVVTHQSTFSKALKTEIER